MPMKRFRTRENTLSSLHEASILKLKVVKTFLVAMRHSLVELGELGFPSQVELTVQVLNYLFYLRLVANEMRLFLEK